jgi:CRP/FNR family cyclic AMP-dependent transcriptional regulator
MDLSASSRLLHHPLFAGLPLATVERISVDAHNVAFDPGQVILSEGSPANTLYLLQHGKVALSAHAPGRGHLLVQTLGPGEVLGLSWLFPPYKWRFDGHAVEFVEALAVDGARLRARIEEDPVLGYQVIKRIAPLVVERLQQTRTQLVDLYGSARESYGNRSA